MKIHPCVLKQSKIICTPSDPGNFNLLSVALVFYKQMAEMQRVLLGSKGTEAAQVIKSPAAVRLRNPRRLHTSGGTSMMSAMTAPCL